MTLECKPLRESLNNPKILEKAGMFSSGFPLGWHVALKSSCATSALSQKKFPFAYLGPTAWASHKHRAEQWAEEETAAEQKIGWCRQGLQGLCGSSRLEHCPLLSA